MLLLVGSFLLLLIVGVPVALSMAVSSLLYVLVDGTMPDIAVLHRMIGGVDSFPLLAVPFFILAGNLMNIAGVTNRIYQFAVSAVGWMRVRASLPSQCVMSWRLTPRISATTSCGSWARTRASRSQECRLSFITSSAYIK